MSKYFIFFPVLFFIACSNPNNMLEKGDTLPEYTGVTPTGDTLKLSSITKQKKIILINFWAAWCSDCLKHNPELVLLNKKYSGQKFDGHDFELVSISLDQDTGLWKRRIVQQNMNWENHITDSKGWESLQLKPFSVHVIPANYLVDHTGKIIAADVSVDDFEKILEKYYQK